MANKIDSTRSTSILPPAVQPTQNLTSTSRSQTTIQSLSTQSEAPQSFWDQFCQFFARLLDILCCRSKPSTVTPEAPTVVPENAPLIPETTTLIPKTTSTLRDTSACRLPSESDSSRYFDINPAPVLQEPLQQDKASPPEKQETVQPAQESSTRNPIPPGSQVPLCYLPSQKELYALLKSTWAFSDLPAMWAHCKEPASFTPFFFEKFFQSISHEFAYNVRPQNTIEWRIVEIYRMHCLCADKMKEHRAVGESVAIELAMPLHHHFLAKTPPAEMRPATRVPSFSFLSKETLSQKRQEARAWIQARWIHEDAFDGFIKEHMDTFNQLPNAQKIWILYELLSDVGLVTKLTASQELEEARSWIQKQTHAGEEFATLPAHQQVWILYVLLRTMHQSNPQQQSALQSVIQTYSIQAIPN